jgi:cytoskeletal protein CcmA (bactofilin family)
MGVKQFFSGSRIGKTSINLQGNNVSIVGGRIVVDGVDITDQHSIPNNVLEIHIIGEVHNLTTDKAVNVQGVIHGNVDAGGAVNCDDIKGNVQARGSVNADNISGSVEAGGSVNCDDIGGNVQAGGKVNADVIHGKKE